MQKSLRSFLIRGFHHVRAEGLPICANMSDHSNFVSNTARQPDEGTHLCLTEDLDCAQSLPELGINNNSTGSSSSIHNSDGSAYGVTSASSS